MNYVLVNPNRLRVTLARWELDSFELSFETLGSSAAGTRRLLAEILRCARARCGFDPGEVPLVIEAFPDGDGGCVLCLSAKEEDAGPQPSVFAFDSMEHVLEACSRLFALYGHRLLSSSLYAMEPGYRLVVSPLDGTASVTLPLLSEYGRLVGTGELMAAATQEHGRAIVEHNAVDTLAAYFS